MTWKRLRCLLRFGHELHLKFTALRVYSACAWCDYETPGWTREKPLALPEVRRPLVTRTKLPRKRKQPAKVEPIRRKG